MRRIISLLAALVVVLVVSSCGGSLVGDAYVIENEPAQVEKVEGSELPRVMVDERAAERLGIQTATVERVNGALVVPSAAIYVDPDAAWWVYTNPEPLVFVRAKIELVEDDGGTAVLSSGPPAGTRVVTVGVAELRGIEDEIGH
jgi:hypothetical protein